MDGTDAGIGAIFNSTLSVDLLGEEDLDLTLPFLVGVLTVEVLTTTESCFFESSVGTGSETGEVTRGPSLVFFFLVKRVDLAKVGSVGLTRVGLVREICVMVGDLIDDFF